MSREYADPDCPHCGGEGFIYGASMLDGGRTCKCMLDTLKLMNMERIWKSLSKAREIPNLRDSPPLRPLIGKYVWITAKDVVLRAHLKALAFSQTELWDARVITEKDLVDAWLKTAKAQGHKIYQSEVANYDNQFMAMDISELVEPADLLILKLGVMQTPNKEMHSCVLETVTTRRHLGKPLWIVDQPQSRIDNMSHRAYSEHLEGLLGHWPHIGLAGAALKILGGPRKEPEMVSDLTADDLLVPSEAEDAIDDALSDIEDSEDEGALENDEAFEEDDDEEEEGGDDGEENPMLAAMLENEEKAEQKARKKRFQKKPFKGGGRK